MHYNLCLLVWIFNYLSAQWPSHNALLKVSFFYSFAKELCFCATRQCLGAVEGMFFICLTITEPLHVKVRTDFYALGYGIVLAHDIMLSWWHIWFFKNMDEEVFELLLLCCRHFLAEISLFCQLHSEKIFSLFRQESIYEDHSGNHWLDWEESAVRLTSSAFFVISCKRYWLWPTVMEWCSHSSMMTCSLNAAYSSCRTDDCSLITDWLV